MSKKKQGLKKEPIYEKLSPGEALIISKDENGCLDVVENVGGFVRRTIISPTGGVMTDERQIRANNGDLKTVTFALSNRHCKYWVSELSCNHDDKEHTCCKEECTLTDIVLSRAGLSVVA